MSDVLLLCEASEYVAQRRFTTTTPARVVTNPKLNINRAGGQKDCRCRTYGESQPHRSDDLEVGLRVMILREMFSCSALPMISVRRHKLRRDPNLTCFGSD